MVTARAPRGIAAVLEVEARPPAKPRCVIDNPQTLARELWEGGACVQRVALEVLTNRACPTWACCGTWSPGFVEGDRRALPSVV